VLLTPSIRVPQALALARRGQLQICTGTESADRVGLQDQYVSSARVPKGPWRIPAAEELSCLMERADDPPPGETLELLSLTPEAISDRVRTVLQLGYDLTTTRGELRSDARDSLAQLAPELLDSVTSTSGRSFRLASDARIASDDPQLITTTRDPGQGNRLLGLHVDSQERRALTERGACQRLLSVNIAAESRWFLFVNLSVHLIATTLNESGRADAYRLGATKAGTTFLAGVTDYPVFRVRLDPGQGYLGPVQNMVHDGSTAGARLKGLRVCAFGEFAKPISRPPETLSWS
jgi:hypothetical protein